MSQFVYTINPTIGVHYTALADALLRGVRSPYT